MKKIVSVLLCLLMMMSLCTAVAADEHSCWDYATKFTYKNNGDTHAAICPKCKQPVSGSDKVSHTYEYTNADGTGWVQDGTGTYCICGAKKPVECDHSQQVLRPNADGKTHNAYCANPNCNELMAEKIPHTYQYDNPNHEGETNPNGEYCICGAKKPACDHVGGQNVVDNKDGKTHKVICPKCNAVITEKVEHVFDAKTGKCACGAVKPACDHVGGQNVVDNKDGKTHKVICPKCNAVITEKAEHVFDAKTGKCACGAVKPACDHVGVQNVVDNKDGKTHKVICPKCDAVITEKAEHVFDAKTGKCACGAEKPACKHEGAQKLVPNKDKKTHNAYCPVCNELMAEKIPHTYQYDKNGEFVGRGGKYCLCGAKKPASSGGSTTGTTTATTKSPKTGDMGVVLYAATALLSLSGTAVVIKKRKNDK